MTREEAIAYGKRVIDLGLNDETQAFCELAIKALEQEPCDDCISRQAVLEIYDEWFATCNIADKKESPKAKINALHKVTPIRPKGHWKLVQRGKCIDVCCSNCKAVRIKEYAYNYTIDQLDKEDVEECLKSDDMRYCPYCGSDNREVEE
jgi:hypothetical protein